jgi:hypothetical protein
MALNIEFISSEALRPLDSQGRMDYILKSVKNNKIIVLDGMLSPLEEKTLIQETMKKVDSKFPGIEISTLGKNDDDFKARIVKLLGGTMGGITVIGPSKLVKEIKKDPNRLNLFANMGD